MILLLFFYMLFNSEVQEHRNMIIFYNIDDFVTLEVNDSVIFKNESNENAPNIYKEVSLDQYLQPGNNKVIIKLYNQECQDCHYNPWSLGFEIHKNGDYWDDFFKESKGEKEYGGERIVWKTNWVME